MKHIPDVHNLKNILVLRGEGSLGDAIVSSCCYREIKKANPRIKITVACFGSAYEFFTHNAYVDEVFRLPVRRIIRPNQRWLALGWAALKLRCRRFDLVLDTSDKDFFNWRAFKYIAGGKRVLDCFTSPVPFGAPKSHGSVHEQTVLRQLGVSNPDKSYDLPVPAQTARDTDRWLEEKGLSKYILLNPSGSVAPRRFSPQMLRQLCHVLGEFGLPFVVPAMPSCAEQLEQTLQGLANVYVRRTGSVFELFELVRRSALVVTPDTSVVHIASGYRKPSLVFYNSYSAYNAPDNPKALIVLTDPADVNVFDVWKLDAEMQRLKEWL